VHKPVLFNEVIDYISPVSGGIYIDCTLGRAGHARGLLAKSAPDGKLIGIELDPFMFELAAAALEECGHSPHSSQRYSLINDNYINLPVVLAELGVQAVDGIVFDLGVATEHFLHAERGFSLQREGPLDMRLSPGLRLTAAQIVNKWTPERLADILFQYGEERRSRQIAREIVKARKREKIQTTSQLAGIVVRALAGSYKGRHFRVHPATRTFQALRIAVNNELENVEAGLTTAARYLRPGGRICAISFHSLEDRIVKNVFRSAEQLKVITKKPVRPTAKETADNPRARSAKLRVAEKISEQ